VYAACGCCTRYATIVASTEFFKSYTAQQNRRSAIAFDAPRKTLDAIRREIDAEFGEAAILQAAADANVADRSHVVDTDAPAARMRRVAPAWDATDDDPTTQRLYAALAARAERALRRPSRRGGYLVAGVIGCIIGQIVPLSFMAVMRHSAESGTGSIAAPAEHVAAMPPSSMSAPSESSASRGSLAPAEGLTPSASPRVTTPTDVAEPTAAAAQTVVHPTRGEQQTVATPTPVTAAPEMPTSRPISSLPPSGSSSIAPPSVSSSTPAPASASSAPPSAPVANDSKPMPRRVVKRAQNLATAQQEVRAALSQWLGASGRDNHSIVSDAVVILGADGRTARTQVPTRWGARVVIREQRWERGARGWTLIDDRDASQGP
jgi:hypothetical protein